MLNRNIMGAMRMLQMKGEAGAETHANACDGKRAVSAPWQGDPDPLFAAAKDEPNAWEVAARRGKGKKSAPDEAR